jgi:hypothetical protein
MFGIPALTVRYVRYSCIDCKVCSVFLSDLKSRFYRAEGKFLLSNGSRVAKHYALHSLCMERKEVQRTWQNREVLHDSWFIYFRLRCSCYIYIHVFASICNPLARFFFFFFKSNGPFSLMLPENWFLMRRRLCHVRTTTCRQCMLELDKY